MTNDARAIIVAHIGGLYSATPADGTIAESSTMQRQVSGFSFDAGVAGGSGGIGAAIVQGLRRRAATSCSRTTRTKMLLQGPGSCVEMGARVESVQLALEDADAVTRVLTLGGGKLTDGIGGQVQEQAMKAIISQIPMGALGDPADVANAVVFLSSRQARYISGDALTVDGGWRL